MGQAIASGIFNLTGGAALQAGSAILLSYLLAGATALCCAAVMAEFARELPISGAGFTWTITTLGGWEVGGCGVGAVLLWGETGAGMPRCGVAAGSDASCQQTQPCFCAPTAGELPAMFVLGNILAGQVG